MNVTLPSAPAIYSREDQNQTRVSLMQALRRIPDTKQLPWFDVTDYKAKADGVTDDRAAIQAAVNACKAAGGGVVYFPAGDYYLGNGTILVDNGGNVSMHFRGDGMFLSRLMKGTTATGDILTWNCTNYPCTIQDMGITAALGGNGGVDGLVTTNVMNGCVFERIWFNGIRNGCILEGTDLYISHCLAELCTTVGFVFDVNVNAHACTSYRNVYGFQLKDTSGVVAYPQLSVALVGCRDIESTAVGIHIYQRANVSILGFQCHSSNGNPGTGQTYGAGILVESSSKVRIVAPHMSNLGRGIQFLGANTDVDIDSMTGDKFSDTLAGSGEGIQINDASSDITVTNPRISRTYRSAIFVGSAARVKIRGGTLSEYGSGAVANDDAGVLLYRSSAGDGADVEGVTFNSTTGKSIAWFSGSVGSFVIGRNVYRGASGTPNLTNIPAATTTLIQTQAVSADRGDANVTLTAFEEPTQRFATALTANRTVTLPAPAAAGLRFRIVRTGLGAFTLNVGGLKTIPASTAAFVDVEYSGAAWQLTGYGTL